ncbi:Alpha/Beta hydrolase protein [Aspergillus insuetus]
MGGTTILLCLSASVSAAVTSTTTTAKPISGIFDGIGPAGACPQFVASTESTSFLMKVLGSVANLPFLQKATGQSEDCLTTTVVRPPGVEEGAILPLGWSSMYDGTGLVNFGVDIGKPFIFEAVNYGVGGFGFLAGKEILADGTANLRLLDQRLGLQWVTDSIAYFSGDPTKPLFRVGIMASGSILPAEPVDSARAQVVYDKVVRAGGCHGTPDRLQCLRDLDYTDFLNAVSAPAGLLSYDDLALSYPPRPDGHVLADSAEVLVREGEIVPVPFIIGDQEDKGTLFSLFQTNITTKDRLVDYLHKSVFTSASEPQMHELVNTYGDGLTAVKEGSPFRTGLLYDVFPGFKRRAALLGDVLFTLSRLFYGIWDNFTAKSTRTYLINFIHSQDPNADAPSDLPYWPQWSKSRKLIELAKDKVGTMADDFRSDSFEVIKRYGGVLRL